jgi:hypothetical protein
MSRDEQTGEVRLRIKVLNGDAVLMSDSGPPTELSPQLDRFELPTSQARLWFRAIDTTDPSREGTVREWTTTVTLKYRPPHMVDGVRQVQLFALPGGAIRYTTDGSSPETSGKLYEDKVIVDDSTKFILAMADLDGVRSEITKFDVPQGGLEGVVIDAVKPAVWRRRHKLQSTHAAFEFLQHAERNSAQLAGIDLNVQRDRRYLSLTTDPGSPHPAATIRDWADRFRDHLPEGELTLTVDVCEFERGVDLTSFLSATGLAAEPGEVQQ